MAKKNQVVSKEQKKSAVKHGFATSAKAKVAAGVVGVATLFGPVACDNGASSTPKVCECPNGMTHDGTKDMPCCEGENCTCKQQFEYLNAFLGVKVVVENQSGKDVKNYAGIIKGYFDDYGQYLPGEADNINARGGVLTIVIESSTGNAYTAEGYRIVNSTTFATSYEFLTSHEDADLLTLLDFGIVATASSSNAKANVPSVIRLANW